MAGTGLRSLSGPDRIQSESPAFRSPPIPWIEPLAAEERRRPYRLTDAGADVVRRHLASLERVVSTVLVAAIVERGARRPTPDATWSLPVLFAA
jgi:hypothetical protein